MNLADLDDLKNSMVAMLKRMKYLVRETITNEVEYCDSYLLIPVSVVSTTAYY